ncbi:hypothetical protein [Piscibacillus salipiscarius]|uniref:Uncharacterized protein n=1 Tax=Piscibacillus salipiscarius TaxID=299480 RepID=A0ABW5QBV6_9BACI|nr:hypothetical protein [Piscibacillus salipiscarius]
MASRVVLQVKQISSLYQEKMGERDARQLVEGFNKRFGDVLLKVELDSNKQMHLLENFRYHKALQLLDPDRKVMCEVYPEKGERDRLIYLLRIGLTVEKYSTKWLFKHTIIKKLMNKFDYTLEDICAELSDDKYYRPSDLKKYLVHRNIPSHIEKLSVMVGARSLVERIASSQVIPTEVKDILYEKAILPKQGHHRLTIWKFNLLQKFFRTCSLTNEILNNQKQLKLMIDTLIAENFRIDEHMRNLYQDVQTETRIEEYTMCFLSYQRKFIIRKNH